ncbi:hypothetical protein ZWY2020_001364 [Hordeum vulgare]|nr:hypothetical protein ZWY2020_001364 [Hordeum vulgare]
MSNAAASAVGATIGDEPSLTASTIDAQAVGSHILRINGYSYTIGLGTGNFMKSESFTVGGHRWYVKYYPDGSQKNSCYVSISIYLCLDHTSVDEVKAKFRISLLDQAGSPVPSYIRDGGMCTFSHRQGGSARRGYCDFIRRSALESDYLKDDVFSLRCDGAVALG